VSREASPLRRAARLEIENGAEVLGVLITVHTGNTPLTQHMLKVRAKLARLLGEMGELLDK